MKYSTMFKNNVFKNNDGFVVFYNDKNEPHNLKGPAKKWPDGYSEYWVDGVLHREDGSAIFDPDNSSNNEYYIKGENLTEQEFVEYRLQNLLV